MINYKNKKAVEAKAKMMNLAIALGECGIHTELVEDHDSNIISLSTTMWNCINGSDVEVCVYAMEAEGYEVNSYAEPEGDRAKALARLENWGK